MHETNQLVGKEGIPEVSDEIDEILDGSIDEHYPVHSLSQQPRHERRTERLQRPRRLADLQQ